MASGKILEASRRTKSCNIHARKSLRLERSTDYPEVTELSTILFLFTKRVLSKITCLTFIFGLYLITSFRNFKKIKAQTEKLTDIIYQKCVLVGISNRTCNEEKNDCNR